MSCAYFDLNSFKIHVKTDDFCVCIPKDLEDFDTSNYELERQLRMGETKT